MANITEPSLPTRELFPTLKKAMGLTFPIPMSWVDDLQKILIKSSCLVVNADVNCDEEIYPAELNVIVLPVFINGDVNVNTFSFVANPDVNYDVVAYELKSKLIVFDVFVNGAENVNVFSVVFKFVIVA